jgi:hypothetical protein
MPAVSLHPAFGFLLGPSDPMRAEIATILDEIKQSLGLLRRHL